MKKLVLLVAAVFASMLFMSACSSGQQSQIIKPGVKYVISEKGTPQLVNKISLNAIGGGDVMPIGGFYGPHTSSGSENGQGLPEYVSDEYFKMIADAGVNTIVYSPDLYGSSSESVLKALNLTEKYNMAYFADIQSIHNLVRSSKKITQLDLDNLKNSLNTLARYPSFAGLHITDEPNMLMFDNIKTVTDMFYSLNYNGLHTYVNMYPTYSNNIDYTGTQERVTYRTFIEDFLERGNQRFLSYDHYPFRLGNFNKYFENLSIVRDVTEANKQPFWAYVQAGGQWNDAAIEMESTDYYPSEGEFLWLTNTALAYGAKGIQYFPLIQPKHFAMAPGGTYDYYRNGMIGAMGNKNEWYYYAQKANKQIAAIDSVLMNSTSMGLFAVGSLADSEVYKGVEYISSKSFRQLKSASGEALIGCFDYKGGTALYVVNFDRKNKQDIKLNFNDRYGYEVIQREETISVAGSTLNLTLEAGEGVLVVLK